MNAERGDQTSVTQAATPSSLGVPPSVDNRALEPAGPNVGEVSTLTTAGEAYDKTDLARARIRHTHSALMPLFAAALTLLIGGDPGARFVFCAGMVFTTLCNVWLLRLAASAERYHTRFAGILWLAAMAGMQTTIYYFGPFSSAVIVDLLCVFLIAIGRERWLALGTAVVCIASHLILVTPIILGWSEDPGFLPSLAATPAQRIMAEVFIIAFLVSSYVLGRWIRGNAAGAADELESAKRIIGDREQALAEVVEDAARQKRANEGRWTDQQLGPWRVGLVLGRGAMGEVYEAVGDDGRLAALKLLNTTAASSSSIVERFGREMRLAARLDSPYIVKVLEVSPPTAPVPYIAMERLEGIDLAQHLRNDEHNRLSLEELLVLLDQVARGLEVARAAGVVHRDLKPHNLFRHQGVTWKILDFGISKAVDSEGTLTGGGIVGTPQYMAPEQASGGDVTHLADLYALGAIAYRCLTGRSPFRGSDLGELVYQVVHMSPERPSTFGPVPRPIEDVLAVALAKDQRKRFQSATEFAAAFTAASLGKRLALDVPRNAWQ